MTSAEMDNIMDKEFDFIIPFPRYFTPDVDRPTPPSFREIQSSWPIRGDVESSICLRTTRCLQTPLFKASIKLNLAGGIVAKKHVNDPYHLMMSVCPEISILSDSTSLGQYYVHHIEVFSTLPHRKDESLHTAVTRPSEDFHVSVSNDSCKQGSNYVHFSTSSPDMPSPEWTMDTLNDSASIRQRSYCRLFTNPQHFARPRTQDKSGRVITSSGLHIPIAINTRSSKRTHGYSRSKITLSEPVCFRATSGELQDIFPVTYTIRSVLRDARASTLTNPTAFLRRRLPSYCHEVEVKFEKEDFRMTSERDTLLKWSGEDQIHTEFVCDVKPQFRWSGKAGKVRGLESETAENLALQTSSVAWGDKSIEGIGLCTLTKSQLTECRPEADWKEWK